VLVADGRLVRRVPDARHQLLGRRPDHRDVAAHRPLPADSELARAIAVLARAQQDAVWNRQQLANQLRSLLREFFPPSWRPSTTNTSA
jgi:hypothetical protein